MKNFFWKNEGQSLVEVIFAIGIIMVVISGVVFLIISTLGAKTKSYDRKKAIEISQNEIELMVEKKRSDAVSFWNLSSAYWSSQAQTKTDGEYSYFTTATQYSGSGCSAAEVECLNAKVTVSWKNGQVAENFNRFFTKK